MAIKGNEKNNGQNSVPRLCLWKANSVTCSSFSLAVIEFLFGLDCMQGQWIDACLIIQAKNSVIVVRSCCKFSVCFLQAKLRKMILVRI